MHSLKITNGMKKMTESDHQIGKYETEDYLEMLEKGNSEQIKEIQFYMVDVKFVKFITL